MPSIFFEAGKPSALKDVDLLLIFGTTLKVKPFSRLPQMMPEGIPKVLINRTDEDLAQNTGFSN